MGKVTTVNFELIKNAYICEGSSPEELSRQFKVPVSYIQSVIQDNDLEKLRVAHIKNGLAKLQNIQVVQAEKLMDIETQFKKMRIIQLQHKLNDFVAYYSLHGHFYKVHPISKEILKDTNNMPIQIVVPNVGKEISELKESVMMSEGLKGIIDTIDSIINKPKDVTPVNPPPEVGFGSFDDLFKKKSKDDE